MKKVVKRAIIVLGIMMLGELAIAQNSTKESWKEVQEVEIPTGQNIYEGLTKNGNPKYWFNFGDLEVTVSEGNVKHYLAGTKTLVLVKWQNSKGKYKYTVRQKKQNSEIKKNQQNIDLDTLFVR